MEKLGLDYKLLIAQAINFGLFFFIFKKFIAKPFSHFLHEQETKEREKQRILEDIKSQEESFAMKEKELKNRLAEESESLRQKAQEQAKVIRQEMIEEAKKEAQQILIKTRKQLAEEKENMTRDIKTKIADLSLFIVNKALKDYIDEQTQKKLNAYILKNLSSAVKEYET